MEIGFIFILRHTGCQMDLTLPFTYNNESTCTYTLVKEFAAYAAGPIIFKHGCGKLPYNGIYIHTTNVR
jgi:hypothetical protein